jgi:Peptidase inhibitor family I36
MSRFSRRGAMVGLTGAALLTGMLAAVPAVASATAKPGPVAPAVTASPRLQGSTAAATRHTGKPPASLRSASGLRAASQDGACDVGDLCLYYLYSGQGYGSGYDTAHNDQTLFNNHFITSGSGQYGVAANNARAYWNRDPNAYAYVCTGVNYTGTCGWLAPNAYGNLNSAYADNTESVYWGDSAN